jgi:uncharacterized protein DUF4157
MNAKYNSIALASMAFMMVCMSAPPKVQAQGSQPNGAIGETVSPAYAIPPGLTATYQAYVDAVTRSAEALPSDIAARMHRLVGMPGIPFNHGDVDAARYVPATSPRGSILSPTTYGGRKMAGITHGNLIVMSPEAINPSNCKGYAVWAHELTHVAQNRRDGRDAFLKQYLSDAAKYDYPKIPYEVAAYKVQDIVAARYCDVMEGDRGRGPELEANPSKALRPR